MKVVLSCVVLAIACKQAEAPTSTAGSGTGAGSGSGAVVVDAALGVADAAAVAVADAMADAAAPLAAFCVDEDDLDGTLRVAAVTDKSLELCIAVEEGISKVTDQALPARTKCATLDLASGTFTSIAEPTVAASHAQAGPQRKPKIDPKQLGLAADADVMFASSPDGKTIAAVSDSAESKLFILDAASGTLRKTVTWNADGGCMETPSFIGENIYVQYNVCAGPGATGWIVTPAGKKLGQVRGVNPTGTFLDLGNDRYAFEDFGGTRVAFVDGKRGKTLGSVAIEDPEDCDDKCPTFHPSAPTLVRLPAGDKLVQLTSTIAVIDATARKIEKSMLWAVCPKPKP